MIKLSNLVPIYLLDNSNLHGNKSIKCTVINLCFHNRATYLQIIVSLKAREGLFLLNRTSSKQIGSIFAYHVLQNLTTKNVKYPLLALFPSEVLQRYCCESLENIHLSICDSRCNTPKAPKWNHKYETKSKHFPRNRM